jgi:cobalamin-dependent methionine synthase I
MTLLGGTSDYAFIVDEYLDTLFLQGDQIFHIEGGYQVFDTVSFHQATHEMIIADVAFDVKKVVYNMLKRSSKVAVFVCTAGEEIHNLSRQYMNEGDLLKGYVYDLFGSLVVECGMDLIQASLQMQMSSETLKITNRYSPGYCGWDVAQQKKLFSLFSQQFNFVQLSDSCLMKPIKSVSGIIGIGHDVRYNDYTCNICDLKNCLYKNIKH